MKKYQHEAQRFQENLMLIKEGYRILNNGKAGAWEHLKRLRYILSKKEYEILKLRVLERKTLEEIGRLYGVTRERVRMIEARAMVRIQEEAR